MIMKNILCGAVAAIALVAAAAPAAAQTSERHYAGTLGGGYTITNPGGLGTFLGELGVALQVGTRYRASADAPADSETATPTVNVVFNLTGSVNKDCSFYSGNNAGARNIDFGVIGIRTGNNENVNNAFEMVGPAVANIDTLTAGCNFNNEVSITKNDVNGLVNTTASGYDTVQFQNNIPYSVTASWTGVALGAVTTGSPQSLAVSTTDLSGTEQQGAWRSRMDIDIAAPAVTSKGLVAGTYTGTTTLTLSAL
jgi:opacity protein-like surface antigen